MPNVILSQDESVSEKNGALEHLVTVLGQPVWFRDFLPLLEERVNQRDRLIVKRSWAVPLPFVHCNKRYHKISGARPFCSANRHVDLRTGSNDLFQTISTIVPVNN